MSDWKGIIVGIASLITVVILYLIQLGPVRLSLHYPVSGNYSVVHATCRDMLGLRVDGAMFLKNGTLLTSGSASHQVIITGKGGGEISFVFTQAQEGVFSCRKRERTSEGIQLTGKWANYVRKKYKVVVFLIIINIIMRSFASTELWRHIYPSTL